MSSLKHLPPLKVAFLLAWVHPDVICVVHTFQLLRNTCIPTNVHCSCNWRHQTACQHCWWLRLSKCNSCTCIQNIIDWMTPGRMYLDILQLSACSVFALPWPVECFCKPATLFFQVYNLLLKHDLNLPWRQVWRGCTRIATSTKKKIMFRRGTCICWQTLTFVMIWDLRTVLRYMYLRSSPTSPVEITSNLVIAYFGTKQGALYVMIRKL